jgi:hypothetical protein
VTRTRKHHWRVTYQGRTIAVIAGTPSCPRSLKNSRADIRRRIRAINGAG